MDEKTPRMPPAAGYPFPFCTTSSPSSVFPPMPMFPQQMQQAYTQFLQAHIMQMAAHQHQQQQQQQQQQRLSAGISPVQSDQASSRSESPQNTRKLVLDEDGCAPCPACGERIAENQFASHLEAEKAKLINHITSMKERRNCDSTFYDQSSTLKREAELARIRNNQQKRLVLKRGPSTNNVIRDCLTPFSRQSNDETGSSESPDTKKDEEFGTMKCSSCQQTCPYAIIMSTFDRPKCQMCFDIIRTQSCILSINTPTHQNDEEEEEVENASPPMCKKMKLDIDEIPVASE
ncbi:unnamed protein product [Caenorhabditis bovis]|uniref:Uncharacterized protein n=1 Tax=Caenorhabditis bovis TaxID=2654633 RepID=A0A8S1ERH0_9PELO|nr:unnamed protein product [Caenorhabditis bovis]